MSTDPLVGRQLGDHLRIEERIAEGGMGIVYRARHLLLDYPVALKIVHPTLAGTPEVRERFLREARAAAAITHPNIVTVREVGEVDDQLYLTMDLIEGRPLQEVMETDGPPNAEETVRIAFEILAALQAAHEHGIVHRDLKPGNVMVEQGGGVRVLDLGLAKFIGPIVTSDKSSLTATGQIVGTLGYMAPEQLTGDPVDARTDLYALSVLLYEMVSGRRPHAGVSGAVLLRKIVLDDPEPLDGPLGPVVMQGLARDPDDRPASASAYRRLLAEAVGIPGTPASGSDTRTPEPTPAASTPAPSRRPLALLAGIGLAVASTIIVAVTGGSNEPTPKTSAVVPAPPPKDAPPAPPKEDPRVAAYAKHMKLAGAAGNEQRWTEAAREFAAAAELDDTEEAREGKRHASWEQHCALAREAEGASRHGPAIEAWEAARPFATDATVVDEAVRRITVARALAQAHAALARHDLGAARSALATVDARANEEERGALKGLKKQLDDAAEAQTTAARDARELFLGVQARVRKLDARVLVAEQKVRDAAEAPDARKRAARRELATLRSLQNLQRTEVLSAWPLEVIDDELESAIAAAKREETPVALKKVTELGTKLQALDRTLKAAATEVDAAFETHMHGGTALHMAVVSEDAVAVARLLVLGVDPNAVDKDGLAPIHVASMLGFADGIQALVAGGALDLSVPVHTDRHWQLSGVRSLHLAAWYGQPAAVTALADGGFGLEVPADRILNARESAKRKSNATRLEGAPPLVVAAFRANEAVTRALLDGGAPRDGRARRYRAPTQSSGAQSWWDLLDASALHVAAARGATSLIALLLDRGMDIEIADTQVETPLIAAAAFGQTDAFRTLLARGASLDHKSKVGTLPIHAAMPSGDEALVRLILDARPAQLEARNNTAQTPLLSAAASGNAPAVRLMLSLGANKKASDKWGSRAIHLAAMHGRIEVLRVLLDAGIEVESRTGPSKENNAWRGHTPLHMAVAKGQVQAMAILFERGSSLRTRLPNGVEAIHVAASYDQPKAIEWILKKGVPVERPWLSAETSKKGMTPLGMAAADGSPNAMRTLLEHGANPRVRWGIAQGTPLHWAAIRKDAPALIDILIDAGTPVDMLATGEGVTALWWAVVDGHVEGVRRLLQRGANAKFVSRIGNYLSAQTEDPAKRKLLRSYGAR